MPWTGSTFTKHNHSLSGDRATHAAHIANAILRSGGSDRVAIATANKWAGRQGHFIGGPVGRALALVQRHAQARGGREPYAFGGSGFDVMRPPTLPYSSRQEIRGEEMVHPGGGILSVVPGRTDNLPMSVASGGYIIPADVVAGMGEGNTLAGTHVLSKMFGTAPYGQPIPHPHGGGHRLPPPPPHFHEEPNPSPYAHGGASHEIVPGHTPIVAAGGEFHVPVESVRKIGGGDVSRGHSILDKFVVKMRDKHKKEISKLPGPSK